MPRLQIVRDAGRLVADEFASVPHHPLQRLVRAAREVPGLQVQLVIAPGRRYVRVTNAQMPTLAEEIECGQTGFVWPWGDPLAPLDDIDQAVAALRRVVLGAEA